MSTPANGKNLKDLLAGAQLPALPKPDEDGGGDVDREEIEA